MRDYQKSLPLFVRYLPCTNFKPARVVIENKEYSFRRVLSFPARFCQTSDVAEAWFAENDLEIITFGEYEKGYVYSTTLASFRAFENK